MPRNTTQRALPASVGQSVIPLYCIVIPRFGKPPVAKYLSKYLYKYVSILVKVI